MNAHSSNSITLLHEPVKSLTLAEERHLAQQACMRRPSPQNRLNLAMLAYLHDDFDAVFSAYDGVDDLSFADWTLLIQAHLSVETDVHNQRAIAAAARAFESAENDADRAQALADSGKAEKRLGQAAKARELLESALLLDPHNKDACKRLAALDFEQGRFNAMLDWTTQLTKAGVGHARLHAAMMLGEAARGDIAAARRVSGYAELSHAIHLNPPAGWDNIGAFNAALAAELEAHRAMRYERYGSASNYSWRIDALMRTDAPLVQLLLKQIADAVQARVQQLDDLSHRWLADKPASAMLRSWCVLTEGDGFEGWHVHQFGWMSGVYYVQIPDEIAQGTGDAGCIGFGLPEELVGDDAAREYGVVKIRPEPGLMLTFPSHTYHRTYPHLGTGKRICVAFDIRPL